MIAQRLLPALAVLSVAAAQSNSICSQPTATINGAGDAAQYTGCAILDSDVLIGKDAVDSILLDGPKEITGSVIAENAGNLTQLGSSTVTKIGKSFTLTNLTKLSSLSWTSLTEVNEIKWSALPVLEFLTFTATVKKAAKVLITNTFLNTLDGINLNTVQVLDINNNNRLRQFSTQVGNITQSLIIDANGQNLQVSFPNLIWAANMTFRNVSSVRVPSLAVVNGSFGLYGTYIESLNAPNLTSVGNFATGQGSLAFVANGNLENITMPLLKSVGGAYQIANNTNLNSIDFPVLANVGGAVDFSGNFSTPSLPELANVRGGFNMQSQSTIDCSEYQKLRTNGVIQGTFTCKTTADAKSRDGTSTDSSGAPATSSSKAAAVSYGTNQAVVGVSVIGGLLGMLL